MNDLDILRRDRRRWAVRLAATAILFLAACGNRDNPPPPPEPAAAEPAVESPESAEGVIVAMGDSLTEGYGVPEEESYPAVLENRLREAGYDFRVVNAGVSGETSAGALSRAEWILNLEPAIVILETGANDGLRGVDPAVTRANIAEILDRFRKRDVVVVLAGMRMVRNLGAEFTDAFETLYPELAAERDAIFVPFFLEGVATDPALNQEDGIHPNAEGYRVVVDTLFPRVVNAIRRWRGANRELSGTDGAPSGDSEQ